MADEWPDIIDDALGDILGVVGVTVSYKHKGAPAAYDLVADWTDEHQEVQPANLGEMVISAAPPVLGIRYSDMQQAPAKGDEVTYKGKSYRVEDVRRDGSGAGADLELKEKRGA